MTERKRWSFRDDPTFLALARVKWREDMRRIDGKHRSIVRACNRMQERYEGFLAAEELHFPLSHAKT